MNTAKDCVVNYYYDGKYEGKIIPELAEEFEILARKKGWGVSRTPFELRVWMLTNSDLY